MKKTSIIIGFSRPKGFFKPFSWLIRLATWSSISHAYIRFNSRDFDQNVVYQASGLAVNLVSQEFFDKKEIVCKEFIIPINLKTKEKTLKNAARNLGKPYSVVQIVGFGFVLMAGIFGLKIRNPFYSKSSFFCSELASDIIIEVGDATKETVDPSAMSPQAICNYLESKDFKSRKLKRRKSR